MPPVSEEEKVLFLISCVRNTGDGKTNWKAVCEERGILSTQAAAKRWSRLSNANPVGAAAEPPAPGAAKEEAPEKAPSGKAPKEDKVAKGKKAPKERWAGASPRKKRKTAKETEAEVQEPQPASTAEGEEGEDEAKKGAVETSGTEAVGGSSD